jgi:hypothetical protein
MGVAAGSSGGALDVWDVTTTAAGAAGSRQGSASASDHQGELAAFAELA